MEAVPVQDVILKITNCLFNVINSELHYQNISKCHHFELESSTKCVKRSIYALKIICRKSQASDKILAQMKDILYNNDDFCEQCTFMFLPEFYHHLLISGFIPAVTNQGVDFGYLAISKYPIYSSFIFNKTDIWLWSIRNILYAIHICNSTPNEHKLMIEALFTSLRNIILHLRFFKKRHWKMITFKLNVIMRIFTFIEKEIDFRLIITKNHKHNADSLDFEEQKDSNAVLQMFMVFLIKWLVYFDDYKQKRKGSKRNKYYHSIKGINRKIEAFKGRLRTFHRLKCIKSKINSDTRIHIKRLLESVSKFKKCEHIIDDNSNKIWKMRKNAQKCQRLQCKQIRGNNKKFYICKRCRVASYCSRKCFKKDWNVKDSVHRNYCQKYVDIMNDKISVNEWKNDIKNTINVYV